MAPIRPRSLRECLSQAPNTLPDGHTCAELFAQAESLARALFDLKKDHKVILPYFTEHNIPHIERIEAFLDAIIFTDESSASQAAFIPTAEEAMYLLAAAWLHDIGMIYGILPNEPLPLPADWLRLRDAHEYRSAEFIQEHWTLSDWSSEQKTYVAELCIHHRRCHSLDKMDPASFTGATGLEVRLRQLAALLRIADACHIDATRAPGDLKSLYTALRMPPDSRVHWAMPDLVRDVQFDHADKAIRPICLIPRPKVFGLLTVDFKVVLDFIIRGIQDELRSVLPCLLRYPNTAFKEVQPIVSRPLALSNPERYMLDMWPYMLTTPTSASEVSCMVAVLAKALLNNRNDIPVEELYELLQYSLTIHPYNFLVRQLDEEVKRLVSGSAPIDEVRRYLAQFPEDRVRACREVAFRAKKCIQPTDNLIIYGYSHTTMALLTEHLTGHEGKIFIVECRRRQDGKSATLDESQRMFDQLAPAGFDCIHVRMASLPAILSDFKKRGDKLKVLLGASGIFNGKSVLSIAGNALIAVLARSSGFDVYVLAESAKLMSNQAVNVMIEDRLKTFAAELTATSEGASLHELVPATDRIDASMYTALIGPEPDAEVKLHGVEVEDGEQQP